MTPQINSKSQINSLKNSVNDAIDDYKYETPPQNKENIEEDDNEVFYSTKKYLSVEKKKSYKLRSTPMRTLQHNGSTPLRETRISGSKKKRSIKTKTEMVPLREESVFAMERLLQSLPDETQVVSQIQTEIISEEVFISEETNQVLSPLESQEVTEGPNEVVLQIEEPEDDCNEVFESGILFDFSLQSIQI